MKKYKKENVTKRDLLNNDGKRLGKEIIMTNRIMMREFHERKARRKIRKNATSK